MKKLATLALLLSLGVFATGCNKPEAKKADKMEGAAPAADAAAPAADAAPPAENK